MSPAIVYLAAGDSEEGFWVQLLVIVLLAAGIGVYGVAKSRIKKQAGPLSARPRQQAGGELKEFYSRFIGAARSAVIRKPVRFAELKKTEDRRQRTEDKYPSSVIRPLSSFEAAQPSVKGRPFFAEATKGKDLKSGMELLAKDFLVGVVEETNAVDRLDIAMRRMCFNELIRREELSAIASDALKVYILDEGGFYGKVIQCAAMKELAGRTGKTPQSREGHQTVDTAEQTTVNAYGEIDG